MKIGIGLIAFNRHKAALDVAQSIVDHLDDRYEYKLVCCIDGSIGGHGTINKRFNMVWHKNVGIGMNKNIAMMELLDCDHVILIEDDILIVKPGWEHLLISIHNESGIQYFPYNPVCQTRNHDKYPSGTIFYEKNHTAQVMSMTQQVLDKVGAFSPEYGTYGFEHCDYTERCKRARMHPQGHNRFACVLELFQYTKHVDVRSCYTEQRKADLIRRNFEVFKRGVKSVNVPFADIQTILERKGIVIHREGQVQ